MKTLEKKTKKEPMHYELSDWFYDQGQDLLSQDLILNKIKEIKEERGIFNPRIGIVPAEYKSFIKDCRERMETRLNCTLVNVRVGRGPGAYKVANEQEATLYGVRQCKGLILKHDRVRRIMPLMKKKYIWSSVRKVFGEVEEENRRFKQLGESFLLAYDKDEKVYNKEVKQIEENKKK